MMIRELEVEEREDALRTREQHPDGREAVTAQRDRRTFLSTGRQGIRGVDPRVGAGAEGGDGA